MLFVALGFIVASFISLWVYYRVKMYRVIELAEKIPGPKPLPLAGNVLDFGTNTKDMFLNMIRLIKEHGPIFRFWLGPQICVTINDPIYVEAILSNTRLLDKAWSYKYVTPWLGTGTLTGTGQKWRTHRKLITPTFHFKILEQFLDVFHSNVDIMIKQLSSHVNGPEFDVYPYITMCALDNICETAMGVSVNAQQDSDSEYVSAIRSICDAILNRSFRPWLHPDFLFNLSSYGRTHNRCLKILHGKTKKVIEKKKKERLQTSGNDTVQDNEGTEIKKRLAFLDLMLQSSVDGYSLTDEEIREEVDTLMFAGHDTTASAMCFTCYCLASYQNIQERAMLELKEIFGDSKHLPTYQDYQNMKYLEQVIKESLRLYPSVPLYGRQITQEFDVDGYTLPAGTSIFLMPYAMHRNPKFFPDPEKFDPDRFLPDNILGRNPYCYVPFAAGPRNCVGQKYAMLEIKAVVCQLLRNYKLLPGITPLDVVGEIVLKSTTGVNITLQHR